MTDLIERLAKLGHGFLQPEILNVHSMVQYVQCCAVEFDLTASDQRTLMSRIVQLSGESRDEKDAGLHQLGVVRDDTGSDSTGDCP
jgi:hypothetical protein